MIVLRKNPLIAQKDAEKKICIKKKNIMPSRFKLTQSTVTGEQNWSCNQHWGEKQGLFALATAVKCVMWFPSLLCESLSNKI